MAPVPQTYWTHDNGGRPFRCVVYANDISVYLEEDKLFSWENTKKIWIGEEEDDGEDELAGNSILVQVSEHKYVFIGHKIYEVDITDQIMEYCSPIGNNDVPYPYAVGENNTYLMCQNVYLPTHSCDFFNDVYRQYYFEPGCKEIAVPFESRLLHGRPGWD